MENYKKSCLQRAVKKKVVKVKAKLKAIHGMTKGKELTEALEKQEEEKRAAKELKRKQDRHRVGEVG
jgi:hypothetical protein